MSRLFDFLRRLARLEPVLLIAVITAIVMTLGIWGVNVTELGDQLGASINVVWPIIALVAAAWTRTMVTPAAAVVQVVAPDGTVTAGPASPLTTGTVIPDPATTLNVAFYEIPDPTTAGAAVDARAGTLGPV